MDVYTYSEARQNFSTELDKAEATGKDPHTSKRRQDLRAGAGTALRVAARRAVHPGGHLHAGTRHPGQKPAAQNQGAGATGGVAGFLRMTGLAQV